MSGTEKVVVALTGSYFMLNPIRLWLGIGTTSFVVILKVESEFYKVEVRGKKHFILSLQINIVILM
jgi:hypothetical protein